MVARGEGKGGSIRARGGGGKGGKVVQGRGGGGGGLDRSGWTRGSRPLVSSNPLVEGETSFASCTITFKFYASTQLETATLTQP